QRGAADARGVRLREILDQESALVLGEPRLLSRNGLGGDPDARNPVRGHAADDDLEGEGLAILPEPDVPRWTVSRNDEMQRAEISRGVDQRLDAYGLSRQPLRAPGFDGPQQRRRRRGKDRRGGRFGRLFGLLFGDLLEPLPASGFGPRLGLFFGLLHG